MKIRLHEADFNFKPTDRTAKVIQGETFKALVDGMKDSPFTENAEILPYMRATLRRIGLPDITPPDGSKDVEAACGAFLQHLVNNGFANWEPEIPKLTPEQKDALLEEDKRYREELKEIRKKYPFSDSFCDDYMMEARSIALDYAKDEHVKIVSAIFGYDEIKKMADL